MLMKKMRDNTKWIMLMTALAFVALTVFEWGMDMSGRSAGSGEIGRVNGTPVSIDLWNATYRNLYDRAQQAQEEPINSLQVKEIEDAAWEEVVSQYLIREELARRGIRVTDEEIRQAALFSPPPDFQNAPGFQTDGRFDLAKYQEFIRSGADDALLLQLETYYRDLIPRGKLLRQVSSGIWIPDAQLWRSFRDENERVEAAVLALDPARIPDSEVRPTAAEIEAYYRERRDDFIVPARARVRIAALPRSLTAADSAEVRAEADRIAEELRSSEDFAEMARLRSDDAATAAGGGSLGVLVPGQTVPPFDSAAFAGRVGEILGPVETPFGLHIIRLDERWGADSVRASHILVAMDLPDATELRLLARADSLERLAETRTLTEVGTEMGIPVEEFDLTEAFPFAPGAGSVPEGASWAFEEGAPGDASPVFETSQAFYALELIEVSPEGAQSLENATPTIEQVLMARRKLERVREAALPWLEEIRSGSLSLEALAEREGLRITTPEPFARVDFVPGLGARNAAIGAAFGLEVGETSGVVVSGNDAFLIQVRGKVEADRTAFEEQKNTLRARTISALQQQRLGEWVAALRKNARVVDRREEVFRAAEELAERLPATRMF